MPIPTKKYRPYLLLLLCSMLWCSCVKDVDFSQAEDFRLEPVMEVSLVYFDLPASLIGEIPDNTTGYTVKDSTKIELFSEPFFDDNLQKATFTFEFTNTIERSFSANIILYNEANVPIDSIPISIEASSGIPIKVTSIVTYNEADIQTIKNMESLEVVLSLDSGTPNLQPDSEGVLDLKSAGTFFMSIDDK
ncbi:hypothetical protein [Galbibacter pacificus]|uniref:DUF1735 domain-containing protein n=1 Tax=Galbibacter pacificus TaxID=2996052 RepID=A0ABT6FMN4_9FLAO|nr:hypothetical protein [Galbibacter pacificus]MDG3580856.1 hypothetical protein [Galbibacter pacificus]MDG3584334.1 hypothetical protein [Galbibacter pacificus]